MFKKSLAAFVFAAGLALAPLIFAVAPAAAQDADQLAAMQADIEALIVEYADDAAGLEAAIEDYVVTSADPELAAQAVIAAITSPLSTEAQAALAANAELKLAAGRGLGAAIAVIALTQPTIAANMLAMVQASGDETLLAAVVEGNEEKTASIQEGDVDTGEDVVEDAQSDSTPEEPASAS